MLPDVIVVGAGLAGLGTAWHLRRRARVWVLDQADQPGAEASSQNAGLVRRLVEDPAERALACRTYAWLTAPGPDWESLEPSRVVGAVLALGLDPLHLNDAVAHLAARGVEIAACDRPAEVAPALAGSPIRAAFWLPGERVADAHAILTGFLRGIRSSGGEVRCGVRVTGLWIEAGRVRGVETDRGRVAADRVVLAAGAWCARLARSAGTPRPLFPLRRTLHQTSPHPLSRRDHPWVWIDDVGLYARPEAGGWLVSGCDEAVDPPGEGPGSLGPVMAEPRARAAHKIERWLPAIDGAVLRSGWSGLRTFAPDRRPMLGADPDVPGLWWCAGLGGSGVTCGFAAGEAVAAWLVGDEVGWLRPTLVSPGRGHLGRWPIRPDGGLEDTLLIDGRPSVVRTASSATG